jgi:hypothetical protein
MTNEQQLASLDRQEKHAKKRVELGNALERLRSNRDFNKLIVDGYLRDEAVRLVHLKASSDMQSPAQQAAINRDIDGIGALNEFFSNTAILARMAVKELSDVEQTRTDILEEGA